MRVWSRPSEEAEESEERISKLIVKDGRTDGGKVFWPDRERGKKIHLNFLFV